MNQFIPGQRVISDAELQNGLGTVLSVEGRILSVLFMATGETRKYAVQTAPLTRVTFAVGDTITRQDGISIQVTEVRDIDGLLVYSGRHEGALIELPEADLDNSMRLNRPSERLLNGQVDDNGWFELRCQTRVELEKQAHSELYGLIGARTSLLPHQLYIAHEVGRRFAPRVLLADEVGLGKTIEAGMILHQQLLTERARRILIIVPETLLHQWLVEMLRRFNLHFRIFDADRLNDPDAAETTENPFLDEQLVLCSLEFLASDERRYSECLDGRWDLLVVDEAHHLKWSVDDPSHEYSLVEQLAQRTDGVLLLTATPEQLGKESHFARLRLLDPSRFHDYEAFLTEERSYEPVAQVVEHLIEGKTLDTTDLDMIESTFDEGDNRALLQAVRSGTDTDVSDDARLELVEHLLDRHGTGRVLFRNTRAAVKGFPSRQMHPYPLPMPEAYRRVLDLARDVAPHRLLAPESLYVVLASEIDATDSWTTFDPRLVWLMETVERLYPAKVLVIAAGAETALDIAYELKNKAGIHTAVFHEGLSIVERDRAAAWFAEQPNGAQVLVCSEIGSEGRNFQFAHHLVLFDLPHNPDLLEQRIGRLDRIGQSETIQIHVPYLQSSAQEVIFRWYHEALDALENTCPAGHSVFVSVADQLTAALMQGACDEALIELSRKLYLEMSEALHKGRDRLLEYNSCRKRIAEDLRDRAIELDQNSGIADYMDKVFDCFGVDSEPHSEGCLVIQPTEHMTQPFPRLNDDAMTITFDRETALTFEDSHYLSWEHPMVLDAMDLVIMQENGNTAVTAIKSKALPAGSLLLECLFMLEVASVESLKSWRFLPPSRVRVVLDESGKDLAERLPHNNINRVALAVDTKTGVQVVRAKQAALKRMLDVAASKAETKLDGILTEAHDRARAVLTREIDRLQALMAINPTVRQSEIDHYQTQLDSLTTVIDSAVLRLDAVRVIVVT